MKTAKESSAILISLLLTITFLIANSVYAQKINPLPFILDMVHNNPGEPMYESKYNDPEEISRMGYNGKVFFLFDSPMLAINWDEMDPDILPKDSPDRAWVDAKAHRLDSLFTSMKKAKINVYAMSDLVLFPKRLVEKYGMQKTFGDPLNPQTEKFLRFQLRRMFEQFPQMDGIVVRIGETYLQDAPYHQGKITNKNSAELCIIPLMSILRDEVCVKLNKKVIFRSWRSFDEDEKTYRTIDAAIEPHPNLIFGVKHCEGDFHRGNSFSRVLGIGRHKQIIEVQCAREYEGKGAYPNYIAHGVIDGFEEHAWRKEKGLLWNLNDVKKTGLLAGVWTWTRGGGWEGPYIRNELWCDLNAWVMAQWSNNTSEPETSVFNRYATQRLGLNKQDAAKFRELALLSEQAVIRGRRSLAHYDKVATWWSRDQYLGFPVLPKDSATVADILQEKDTAVKEWRKIVKLSKEIRFRDNETARFARVSSEYGLDLYRIARTIFYLSAASAGILDLPVKTLIEEYDVAWRDYEALLADYPDICPTLYSKNVVKRMQGKSADERINAMRK